MRNPDNLFDSMVKEAMEEVANHGWKSASDKAVTLAAFGMMANKVNKRIDRLLKPLWVIGISVVCSAIWFGISKLFGL